MASDPVEEDNLETADLDDLVTAEVDDLETPESDELVTATAFVTASSSLHKLYLVTNNVEYLHQAIGFIREGIDVFPPDVRGWPFLQWGIILMQISQHSGEVEPLTEAIEKFQTAFWLLPDDDPLHRKCFELLSITYLNRNGSLDRLQNLYPYHADSQSGPSLVNETLGEVDEVFVYFQSKTDELQTRYLSGMRMEDLDSAIDLARHALRYYSSNPVRSAAILMKLTGWLTWRFDRQHNLEDVNEAAEIASVGLELVSPQASDFVHWQSVASKAFVQRFEALGRLKDLQNAVGLAKSAVEAIEVRDPDLARSPRFAFHLDSLAWAMTRRYQTTGDVSDLEAAIEYLSRAIDISEGDAQLPTWLNNLSLNLELRYHRNGRAEDLANAVTAVQRAVNLFSPEDPNLITHLANLSGQEINLCLVLRDEDYFHQASQHIRQAWVIRNGNPGLSQEVHLGLYNTTLHILGLFENTANMQWLLEALGENVNSVIDLARISTSVTNHPLAITSYNFLSIFLFRRWDLTHNIEDIDEAICTAHRMKELADAILEVVEESVLARVYLGVFLYDRFKSTGDNENREQALAIMLEVLRTSTGTPYHRIWAGNFAVIMFHEMADWHSAYKLLEEIIDLFMILNGRSQPWPMKQFWSTRIHIAEYASIALEAGSKVLDVINMLETCRGMILGNLIDKRVDLDDLMEAHPAKANLLATLQNEITTESVIDPSEDMNARVKQTARKIEAERQIRACLEDIRTLKGFHRFLLGPTEEELKAAAARGPIVIVNVTGLRSDAIIITKDALDLLPLPALKCEKVQGYANLDLTDFSFCDSGRKNKKYRELQAWLWDTCVKLIFQKLETLGHGPAKFRMWWVCVGWANFLPFHAAGKYVGNSSENALSRAISSYAPTLKILIHGQQKLKEKPSTLDLERLTIEQQTQKTNPRLTFITMPSTPGKRNLGGVLQEANAIKEIVKDNFSTRILVQPCAKDTIVSMAECEIVHFACHGESVVPHASESHLLLQTTTSDSSPPVVDELKVRDVAAAYLSHGKLAILSACSTAQNKEELLWDEGIHLVGAFHVAGYSHVIGNLWISDDDISVELMKGFYKHLVEAGELGHGENVARALNEALLTLARKYPKQPLSWAQFVHVGI